jgi:glutamate synthase domain-containing protein 2
MPDWGWWILGIVGFLLLVAIHDVFQRKKQILRTFPVIGHIRYWLIEAGPELRQYIVAHNREEAPFNRLEREWIYHSADRENNYFGFGTDDQLYGIGYPIIKHAALGHPATSHAGNKGEPRTLIPCAKVLGEAHKRERTFRPPSIINVSAMSFGALGRNAISALNLGAKRAGCYHNTGEGGLSRYHRLGADVCWQLGTGYFGARGKDGHFDLERFRQTIREVPQVRMVEIKLSQGAKPGKGGVLPAAKVTAEIAEARGVAVGEDCISPSTHSAFHDAASLVEFTETLAAASGLPVGIKSAVGHLDFFQELAAHMKATGKGPDFITIDGGEGGTGAAPLTFADHVALPYKLAFTRVYRVFLEAGLADDIVFIGSAKLGFPDRAVVAIAQGADLINIARESMLSIGCIQAQRCHTDGCPSGVATHNAWLQRGIVPEDGARRFAAYIEAFSGETMAVTHAAGYDHPGQFTPHDIEISSGPNLFRTLYEVFGYDKKQYVPGHAPRFKHGAPGPPPEARSAPAA